MRVLRERLRHLTALCCAYPEQADKRAALTDAILADYEPEWTAVEDGLPGKDDLDCYVMVPAWSDAVRSRWNGDRFSRPGVTHWAPARIPAPPGGAS